MTMKTYTARIALLVLSLSKLCYSMDTKALLKNQRLVLEGANASGMQFKGTNSVVFFAEITRDNPILEARVRWITNNLLFLCENGRTMETCAPRTWLMRIEGIKGNKVTIREYNNTWPTHQDLVSTYSLTSTSHHYQ